MRRRKGQGNPNTLYFTRFCRLRKDQAAKNIVVYKVFALSEQARRPTTLYFICFRAFGKGKAAKKLPMYNVFAFSERARRPNTLYFTRFSRLRKGPGCQTPCIFTMCSRMRKGQDTQQPCILQGFRASHVCREMPQGACPAFPRKTRQASDGFLNAIAQESPAECTHGSSKICELPRGNFQDNRPRTPVSNFLAHTKTVFHLPN